MSVYMDIKGLKPAASISMNLKNDNNKTVKAASQSSLISQKQETKTMPSSRRLHQVASSKALVMGTKIGVN